MVTSASSAVGRVLAGREHEVAWSSACSGVCVVGWEWGEGLEEGNIKSFEHARDLDYKEDNTRAENLLYPESSEQLSRLSPHNYAG